MLPSSVRKGYDTFQELICITSFNYFTNYLQDAVAKMFQFDTCKGDLKQFFEEIFPVEIWARGQTEDCKLTWTFPYVYYSFV